MPILGKSDGVIAAYGTLGDELIKLFHPMSCVRSGDLVINSTCVVLVYHTINSNIF